MMRLKRRQVTRSLSTEEEAEKGVLQQTLPQTQTDVSLAQRRTPFLTPKRQLAIRRGFFVVVMIGCGVLLFLFFRFALSDSEPPFYTITSTSEYDNDHERALQEWEELHKNEDPSLIHLLHSRFMQQQGNLTSLAEARLLLFEVFCLPSIVGQTSQNFLWIIKTDPHLDHGILQKMITLLEPYDNFYLVASNVNFLVNQNVTGAWRESEPRDLQESISHIYTGDRKRLSLAMALSKKLHTLETRLDADDGLNKDYMKYVQNEAMRAFQNHKNLRYKYWCSRRSLEWHWKLARQKSSSDKSPSNNNNVQQSHYRDGTLEVVIHSKMCITPGITVGFPKGVKESEVPVVQHNLLRTQIHDNTTGLPCGAKKPTDCLAFVEGFMFDAIRSRTPTSAGMLEVLALKTTTDDQETKTQDSAAIAAAIAKGDHEPQLEQLTPWMQYAYWHFLYDNFRVSRKQVQFVQSYMQGINLYNVAKDNLSGQCTELHSCKETAKRDLEAILKVAQPAQH